MIECTAGIYCLSMKLSSSGSNNQLLYKPSATSFVAIHLFVEDLILKLEDF
jgi:hypothetical protein